jgi:hypothetical protein
MATPKDAAYIRKIRSIPDALYSIWYMQFDCTYSIKPNFVLGVCKVVAVAFAVAAAFVVVAAAFVAATVG